MEFEREQGFQPRDVSAENRGYDIESRDPKPTGFASLRSRAVSKERRPSLLPKMKS